MQQRTFTQKEFRKELLEGTDSFLVDPMELSKESLDVLEQMYNTTGHIFKDIVLEGSYIRKGKIKEVICITSKFSWAGKSYYKDAQHYIIKVLPEKTIG